MKKIRNKITNKVAIVLSLAILIIPTVVIAQTINSGNYQIEDSTFDSGGESSNSANYSSRDSIDGIETGDSNSANYKNPSGFQPGAYPGIPATPTFTNTGGTLYNSLDFIVATGNGQQSDTTYAIAISSDNFVTTNFIQTDDTVGSAEAWQTYSGWNSGTGERVTGLSPSTTYKIKVKASYGTGSNAADSESGYSPEASATTSAPSIVVSIAGVSSGVLVGGLTTTDTSTSTTMGYGTLTIGDGSPNIAAQTVTVTTNATGGYTATIQQDGDLRTDVGDSIPVVTGTNASPAAFGVLGAGSGKFGYHTTDSSLCTGTTGRFTVDDTYAALTLAPFEIACSTGPVTNEQTSIVYKLVIGSLQEAGNYQNTVTYIATATY
jgi:hypothetical protein